jgi:exodeoxyribonuclease III
MKIASWNVNSLRVRLPQLADWLREFAPDALGIQETKVEDDKFPVEEIEDLGYEVHFTGQKTYNGVAILTRGAQREVSLNPGGLNTPAQVRAIACTLENGVRLLNVYVVNGQALDSEKFQFKLRWLADLHSHLQAELLRYPRLVVVGDFNIAPADADVYDPIAWGNQIHCSIPERGALAEIHSLGFSDSLRLHRQDAIFSWWDYRKGAFQRNLGLRIDLALVSNELRAHVIAAGIDQTPRASVQPSDHAPIWLTLGDL